MHLVSFLSHVHSSKSLWEHTHVQDFANTCTRPNTVTKCTRSKPCEHMHSFRTRWAHAITENLQVDALVQDCIPPESYLVDDGDDLPLLQRQLVGVLRLVREEHARPLHCNNDPELQYSTHNRTHTLSRVSGANDTTTWLTRTYS